MGGRQKGKKKKAAKGMKREAERNQKDKKIDKRNRHGKSC